VNKDGTDTRASGASSSPLQAEYAFQMDDDLTKYVKVVQFGRQIVVRVRYGKDVILQDNTHRLRSSRAPEITADQHGVRIDYETSHLFGLVRWPRSVRF